MLGLETFDCPVPLKPFEVRTVCHPRTDDSVGQWLRAVVREAAAKMTHTETKGTGPRGPKQLTRRRR
jgi:hypothetical protein